MIDRVFHWIRNGVVAAVMVVSLAVVSAYAQPSSDELDRRARDLYQKVFSPFCAGRSLNDCPSSKAQELKAEMRRKLELGVPSEVILDEVFHQFGEKYRAVPQYEGFGKLVWWVPFSFVFVGAVVALLIARGGPRGTGDPAAVSGGAERAPTRAGNGEQGARPANAHDEVQKQIERELAALD